MVNQKKKVGVITKDLGEQKGSMCEGWLKALNGADAKNVDITTGISNTLAVKDDVALQKIRLSTELLVRFFRKVMWKQIVNIIDEDGKVSHQQIGADVERGMENPASVKDLKWAKLNLNAENIEVTFTPVVQSGGNFNFKFSTENSKEPLQFNNILMQMAVSWEGYHAGLSRTLLINPPRSVEKAYDYILKAQEMCIQKLKPGVTRNP
jgi:nucleosome binding factor SPN SPT16 subunit